MKHIGRLVILACMIFSMSLAGAHHSTAAFDMAHPVTASGTVKRWVWANPHTWLYLMVPNDKGGEDEWEIVGPSVAMLARQGWKSTSMKPGDKVQVIMGLRRDGTHGGAMMRVQRADGTALETWRTLPPAK